MLKGDEIVVLDNYFFTTDYQKAIKEKGCKLVCIDDMHDKHYVADVVINHGINNPGLFSIEPYTRLCLGVEWALLRKPFIDASINNKNKNHSDKIENVVVSFGGVDKYHITDKVINILMSKKEIKKIDAIVGATYQENNDLLSSNVLFHRSVSAQKIADVFSNCDLAILSASTVCLEALACNTIVAAGYYVDNQEEYYEYLKYNHFIHGLGSLLKLQSLSLQDINFQIKNILPVQNVTKSYITYFNTLN